MIMFEQISGLFQKKTPDTLVLARAEVPAWLDGHEQRISADLAESARHHGEEVSLIIGRLQQSLKALQEKVSAGEGSLPAIVPDSLDPFLERIAPPLSAELPRDICGFFAEAENIFGTCNEALAGSGPDLSQAFPEEIAAFREDSHALGRALLAARVPVIEKCRARRERTARVREILEKMALAEQESAGAGERMTWIAGKLGEIEEDLVRIRTDQEAIESDPTPFLDQQQASFDSLVAKREEIRQSFAARAEIASALMLWARTIASEKNDTYGSDVLFELIQLLTGREVPREETLMPSLACAFEIILDMVENGSLVPGNDEAAELLKRPADFNKDLCRICREYTAADAQLAKILVGPEAVAARKQQMNEETGRLQAEVRGFEAAEEELKTRRMFSAREQWSMKKPLEDAIGNLIGAPVQIRLNGENYPGQKQG